MDMRFFLFLIIFALAIALIVMLVRHFAGAKLRRVAREMEHVQNMDEFDTDVDVKTLEEIERQRQDEINELYK